VVIRDKDALQEQADRRLAAVAGSGGVDR
jgi:hypothetical protein